MSDHMHEGIQNSATWIEGIRDSHPSAIAEELIVRAYEVVATQPEGRGRAWVEDGLLYLLDPEACEEQRLQKTAASFVSDTERWLGGLTAGVDDAPGNLAEIEHPDFGMSEEHLAELRTDQALETFHLIHDTVSAAEAGLESGKRPSGGEWIDGDTIDSIRTITRLQKELGMPIVSDRLREVIIHGLNTPHNGRAAYELLEIADETKDYAAFEAAADKYKHALENDEHTYGSEVAMVTTAAKFIETGEAGQLNHQVLDIALTALARYDSSTPYYPIACARLGLALQSF